MKSRLGDNSKSLIDIKSRLGDAKSSSITVKSRLDDAKSSSIDAKSRLGDAKVSLFTLPSSSSTLNLVRKPYLSTHIYILKTPHLPSAFVLLIDIAIVAFSVMIAYELRFNFAVPASENFMWRTTFLSVVFARLGSFWWAKTHRSIVFHTSVEDAQRIFYAVTSISILLMLGNVILYIFASTFIAPYSVLGIEYLGTMFGLTAWRVTAKILFLERHNYDKEQQRVVIYGALEGGLLTKKNLRPRCQH